MTYLDKTIFSRKIPVLALRVAASAIGGLREKISRESILDIPRVKTIVQDQVDPSKRLLLLSERISDEHALSDALRSMIAESKAELVPYEVSLGYEHFTTQEVLSRLLPEGSDIPSSFETVGHIAHVNLRDEHDAFKPLIGQKNRHIKTVVNKVGAIDAKFRFFQMEVIAGEPETIVNVFEEGCHFRFDYAKVYWNSRLQFEHCRVVQLMQPHDNVCDMFCGVGPFVLPAAKRGCTVYANDLNPESTHWLEFNVQRNRLSKKVKIYNLDAREFVRKALADLKAMGGSHFDHFLMNLPASAHEFLDVFPQIVKEGMMDNLMLQKATIHCYIFCKTSEDPLDKIESGLGRGIVREDAHIKRVRDVAPNKEMFCVSFKLPRGFLKAFEGSTKRAKIDEDGDEDEDEDEDEA